MQSSLVAARIRRLAEEKKLPVIACVEDAAASGGYWIACAADEIVADPSSILGSIGVIARASASPRAGALRGGAAAAHGGDGEELLDPFRPEQPEDAGAARDPAGRPARRIPRLGARAARREAEGAAGGALHRPLLARPQAVELGLADRLGDAAGEAKRRFGDKARLVPVGGAAAALLVRLLPGLSAEALMAAAEERAAWARLGL